MFTQNADLYGIVSPLYESFYNILFNVNPQSPLGVKPGLLNYLFVLSDRKKAMEMELLNSKTELMTLNNQLLEAVQHRLELSLELEAWKVCFGQQVISAHTNCSGLVMNSHIEQVYI